MWNYALGRLAMWIIDKEDTDTKTLNPFSIKGWKKSFRRQETNNPSIRKTVGVIRPVRWLFQQGIIKESI